jgi:hypothetical protein
MSSLSGSPEQRLWGFFWLGAVSSAGGADNALESVSFCSPLPNPTAPSADPGLQAEALVAHEIAPNPVVALKAHEVLTD